MPKSMAVGRAASAGQTSMEPPPPSPLIQGSTAPSASEVATAASTALPPASRTAAPTAAAWRFWALTIPPLAVTAGLRTVQVLARLLLKGRAPSAIGVGGVAQAVAQEIEGEHHQDHRHAGQH